MAGFFRRDESLLRRYPATQVPSYPDTWLPRYLATQVPNYLNTKEQLLGVFEPVLDRDQEGHGLAPVDDAVVVGQRDVHHRADLDLLAVGGLDGHRTAHDVVHAEDAGLRHVEQRRAHHRAVDAAVRDAEGAALELGEG